MAKILTRVNSGTQYEVTRQNPLLALGEPFYETDTGGFKVGNGSDRYLDLKYTGIVLERTGIQGERGEKGEKGDKGDTGLTGSQGISAYQVAVANGFSGNVTQWLTSLIGAKGDKGDKGDQGIQGIQGLKGDQGIQGIQGLKGDKGDKGDTGNTGPAASWSNISDKPVVIASGADKNAARVSIDAVGAIQTGIVLWIGTETDYTNLPNSTKFAAGFVALVY